MSFAVLDNCRCPIFEKAEHFLPAVTFAFFQETGVLDVEHGAFFVENYKDREAETGRVAQPTHQPGCLFQLFLPTAATWIVIDMKIDEVGVHHAVHSRVFL